MTLLPFQTEDVDKLKSKRSRLVGNDPGTGKTYEGIALDQANRNGDGNDKPVVLDYLEKYGPPSRLKTLVVCPKVALDVWDEHLMELTDDDIYLYDYHHRERFMQYAADPRRGGYFIVNYDSVRIDDLKDLRNLAWFHIIGDEIHRIKNRKAQITLAFKKIPAIYKTGMSGTFADNNPQDAWSVLNWLWPRYYTSYWKFVRAYAIEVPVMKKNEDTGQLEDTGYNKTIGVNPETIPILHAEMEPWYVRRRKKDVLLDLPDKYYSRIWVDLGPKQRAVYNQMKKTMTAWCEDHRAEIEREDPIIAQAVVVQLIRLQQMTAGYLVAQLGPDGKQVIKAYHKCPLDKRPKCTEENPYRFDGGKVRCRWAPQWDMTDPSAKLDALMDLLKDRPNDSIILFSQSKAAIKLAGERLARAGISYGLYTGDTKQAERDQLVRDFQAGAVRVFAGTIKAGGESITLTRSSTVVFLDRWWSPSKNIQAEDRAHRIGQKEAVEVIDIMARNTVDLGRFQQISNKWKALQMLMGDEVDQEAIIREIELGQPIELDQEE